MVRGSFAGGRLFGEIPFLICFFEAICLITPDQDVTETASVCPYLQISPGSLLPIIRDIFTNISAVGLLSLLAFWCWFQMGFQLVFFTNYRMIPTEA